MVKPRPDVAKVSRRRLVQGALGAASLVAVSQPLKSQVSGPGTTGAFTVWSDGKIYDPQGKDFKVRGANLFPHQNGRSFVKALGPGGWGFNALRLDCLPGKFTYAQLDRTIDTYTALGMVAIVDWHQVGGYGDAPADRKAILDHFSQVAKQQKNNPHVWYGGYNEPGGPEDCTLAGGEWAWDATRVDKWVDLSRTIVEAVRDAGATSPVFVPSMVVAQDIAVDNHWKWQFQKPLTERSAILAHGSRVLDGLDNVVFDVHLYGNYNAKDRLQHLDMFLEAAKSRGVAIVFGEYGMGLRGANGTFTSTIQSSKHMAALRAKYHFGDIVWHASAANPNDVTIAPGTDAGVREVDNPSAPTNLTELGKIAWEGTH